MTSDIPLWRAERIRAVEATCGVLELEGLTQSLACRLDESRDALSRLCVAALPDDVLCCIFEQVVSDGDEDKEYVPFALAAVCARWRRVALGFPTMWSAINLYANSKSGTAYMEAQRARVSKMLSRSHVAPLRLGIQWFTSIQDPSDPVFLLFAMILKSLGEHVARWKTAFLFLPVLAYSEPMMEFLMGPTPLLTELYINTWYEVLGSLGTGYLPFAPVLSILVIEDVGLGWSRRAAFPALTKLSISGSSFTEDDLYDCIARAPAIQYLELSIVITHAPPAKISLPRLESLEIGYDSQPLLFDVSASRLCTTNLTHLVLNLVVLQALHKLEELGFVYQTATPRSIEEPVLTHLATSDPPVWPRLATLTNLRYTQGMGEHVLALIASRNSEPPAVPITGSSPPARPCRFRKVEFWNEVPAWLEHEIDRLLL
ncbi:hypothetical protein AURDEDRAFT_159496 [Auricularia subglabra TFB-10046 SS5]|nr:hypothetical protein AURDEDRAFT_159496 [Auricularia subglabra TFB-10046 SS5]